MSTNYNFSLLDLNEEKVPPFDSEGQYCIDFRPTCESIEIPHIYRTNNNYYASYIFTDFLKLLKNKDKRKEKLKLIFGNMFWRDNYTPNNQGNTFFFNYWNLNWHENHVENKVNYFLGYYSIHVNHIRSILEQIDINLLNWYYSEISIQNNLNRKQAEENEITIKTWIQLFQYAVNKNKGIVYNIA